MNYFCEEVFSRQTRTEGKNTLDITIVINKQVFLRKYCPPQFDREKMGWKLFFPVWIQPFS